MWEFIEGMSERTRPAAPRLERRTETFTYAVDELLDMVRQGRVRTPSFQRDLRWRDGDKLALLDSIYRGYPIGTPLLWRRRAESGAVHFGKLYTVRATGRDDALWIVDGQQRITTLVEALLVTPAPGTRALHFDLAAREFVWNRAGESRQADTLLPTSVILDSNALLEWLFAHPALDAEKRSAAIDVGKRIREYRVPTYVVDSPDDTALRVIFDRINRTGRRLTDMEVFHALFDAQRDGGTSVHAVVESLGALHWGTIEGETVVRALRAIRKMDRDDEFGTAISDGADAADALRRTEAALARAIQFLRDAGMPGEPYVPYALASVVLARFFALFPSPSDRNLILLRRWLWRGSLAQQLTGATVELRAYVRAVEEGAETASVQRLLGLVTREPPEALSCGPAKFATARTKLQCCALASLGPRDLRTSLPVDIVAIATERKSPLVQVVAGDEDPGIAGRLLHPLLPRRTLADLLMAADDDTLRSHAVPPEAIDALREGDIQRFVALRTTALNELFEAFFGRNAEWGSDDSPALSAILEGDVADLEADSGTDAEFDA